jgi:hypothetical protein
MSAFALSDAVLLACVVTVAAVPWRSEASRPGAPSTSPASKVARASSACTATGSSTPYCAWRSRQSRCEGQDSVSRGCESPYVKTRTESRPDPVDHEDGVLTPASLKPPSRKEQKPRASASSPFASTNALRTRSLSPSQGSEGRVPSPGACIEDRHFIAAQHPFHRGSVVCMSPFVSFVPFVVKEPQISEPRIAQSPRIP